MSETIRVSRIGQDSADYQLVPEPCCRDFLKHKDPDQNHSGPGSKTRRSDLEQQRYFPGSLFAPSLIA